MKKVFMLLLCVGTLSIVQTSSAAELKTSLDNNSFTAKQVKIEYTNLTCSKTALVQNSFMSSNISIAYTKFTASYETISKNSFIPDKLSDTLSGSMTSCDTITNSTFISAQQEVISDDNVYYGLIPNPFKLASKVATAPLRIAKAKAKAAKKAAKLAKKGVDTVKDIDGDAPGKEPSGKYEKTPYTKDRFKRTSKDKKADKKASRKKADVKARDRYEDYDFATDSLETQESPYIKKRSVVVVTRTTNNKLNNSEAVETNSTTARANTKQEKPVASNYRNVDIANTAEATQAN